MKNRHFVVFVEWLQDIVQVQTLFELAGLTRLAFDPSLSSRVKLLRFVGLALSLGWNAVELASLIIKQSKTFSLSAKRSIAVLITTDLLLICAILWIFIGHREVIYNSYLQGFLFVLGLSGVGVIVYRLRAFVKSG